MKGRYAVALLLALATPSGSGCKKQNESLVVVALTASDANASLVSSVSVSVAGVEQSFSLGSGLSTAPVLVGVYVSSSATGVVPVTASAVEGGSGACLSGATTADIPAAGATVNVALALTLGPGCASGTGGATGTGGTGAGGATGTGGTGAGGTGTGGTTGRGGSGTGGTTGTGGTGTGGTGTGGTGMGGTPGTGGTGGASTGTGGTGAGGSSSGGTSGATPPTLTKCTEYDHNDSGDPACVDGQNNQYVSDTVIYSVAFSPNGTLFASAGDDGRVKIWSFDGATLAGNGQVISTDGETFATFSPDGSLLVAGSESGLLAYNVPAWSMRPPFGGTTGDIVGLAVTADSKYVVSISDANFLYVHTLANPATPLKTSLPANPLGVAISPSSTATDLTIAIAYATGRAETFDVGLTTSAFTPEDAFTVEQDDSSANTIQYSPDGSLLAIGDADGLVQFWSIPLNALTPVGTPLTFMKNGVASNVAGLSWSPSSAYLAVGTGTFDFGGNASIWRVSARSQFGMVVPTYFPQSVSFSPSGTALAIGEVACGMVMLCTN